MRSNAVAHQCVCNVIIQWGTILSLHGSCGHGPVFTWNFKNIAKWKKNFGMIFLCTIGQNCYFYFADQTCKYKCFGYSWWQAFNCIGTAVDHYPVFPGKLIDK